MSRTDRHSEPWHGWYSSTVWQKLRKHQLMEHPLCKFCAEKSLVVPATIVDHVQPHRGNWTAFRTGALQSLCKSCHDSDKRLEELRGYSTEIGLDGWPVDRRHPAYQRRPWNA